MMVVKVKVFADLRQYIPELGLGESLAVKVESGVTIRQLFEQLEIPESEIKLAFVNGISREFEDILSDGDEVSFFSPVGGG
jgi:molybdopterin converting factor small subunit